MPPAPERIPLPTVAAPERPRGLPLVALVAPLGLALVLWAVTSTPTMLLFALFGPLVMLGGRLDGARSARAARRRAIAEAREALDALHARLAERARQQLERMAAETPSPDRLVLDAAARAWWFGVGDIPSGVELVGDAPPELATEFAEARAAAATLREAPVVLEDVDEVQVAGLEPLVRAFCRALVLQAVARCTPGTARVTAPEGEEWVARLPAASSTSSAGPAEWAVERGDERVLRITAAASGARAVRVALGTDGEAPELGAGCAVWRPVLVARPAAARIADRLAAEAHAAQAAAGEALPREVLLAELLAEQHGDAGTEQAETGVPLGVGPDGPVRVDLEQQGPHALIAGTTGSGKSELLVAWVAALAARHPPDELTFLLVDFKGGSAFAPLVGLPHVLGVVSDLDEHGAARAVHSLRAELRRRETVLAEHAARDIRELRAGVMPRLMVMVDEYAALVAASPELAAVFADLAARGRSLGLHLVLGTQRPAGVVRDAVLANVTVRICLRVLDAGESTGMVGAPDAAGIPAEARGRAVLHDGVSRRLVQLARAEPELIARIAERWHAHPTPSGRPWLDPLPDVLTPAELPAAEHPAGGGLMVGLVDVPEQQRREPFIVDPAASGALLVVGASGSGRTTALSALAAAHPGGTRWVGADPVALWEALATPAEGERMLVLADDLDLALARSDAEQRAELIELLTLAIRESRRTGVALAASVRGVGGLHGALAAFEQRVLLRMSSREDHLLAGGEPTGYRADRRPGSAIWRGHEAQFVLTASAPPPWQPGVVEVRIAEGAWALVTPRPDRWLETLRSAGVAAVALEQAAAGGGTVVVADPDAWLAEHLALGSARRSGRILFHGCSRAEHRTLTRARGPVPPLADDDAWLVEGGATRRVRIVLPD